MKRCCVVKDDKIAAAVMVVVVVVVVIVVVVAEGIVTTTVEVVAEARFARYNIRQQTHGVFPSFFLFLFFFVIVVVVDFFYEDRFTRLSRTSTDILSLKIKIRRMCSCFLTFRIRSRKFLQGSAY